MPALSISMSEPDYEDMLNVSRLLGMSVAQTVKYIAIAAKDDKIYREKAFQLMRKRQA